MRPRRSYVARAGRARPDEPDERPWRSIELPLKNQDHKPRYSTRMLFCFATPLMVSAAASAMMLRPRATRPSAASACGAAARQRSAERALHDCGAKENKTTAFTNDPLCKTI